MTDYIAAAGSPQIEKERAARGIPEKSRNTEGPVGFDSGIPLIWNEFRWFLKCEWCIISLAEENRMRLATSACSLFAVLLSFFFATAPASAQVSAGDVTLTWDRNASPPRLPDTQSVTVTGTSSVTSVTFSGGGGCTSTGPTGSGLFACSIAGNVINVGILNATLLQAVTGTGTTQTMTITTPAGNATANARLEITTGGTGLLFTPASLTFSVATGTTSSSLSVSISPPAAAAAAIIGVSTSNGIAWLTASLASSTAPTTMQVTVYPYLVTAGTYTAQVNLTIGGQLYQYPISLTVGTTGTGNLTFSENPINFTYVTGGAIGSRSLRVYAAGANTITSGFPSSQCILVDGGIVQVPKSTTPSGGTNYADFLISFNPGIFTGGCSGTVGFVGSNGSSNTLSVTVNSSATGLLTLSQSALTFSYPGGVTQQQIVASTASATAALVSAAVTSGTWLSVTPTAAYSIQGTPATFLVNVAPAGLAAGTYYGQISFSASGAVTDYRTVTVTLVVGGSGVTSSVSPQSLTFTAQAGAASPVTTQSLYVHGVSGSSYTASFVANNGSGWFNLGTAGSGYLPAQIPVSVNSAALAAGAYTGNISVTTPSGVFQVPVTLNVVATPVVTSNPGTIFVSTASASTGVVTRFIDLNVTQAGSTFAYSAAASSAWITVSPTAGVIPNNNSLQVNISPAGLADGTYTGSVTINAPGAGNASFVIPVILVVGTGGGAGGFASPAALNFAGTTGSTALSPQSVTVTGTTSTIFSVSTSNAWIAVNPSSGYIPGSFSVSVNPAGLPTGTTSGSITVTAGTATQTIPVTVSLTSAGGNVSLSQTALNFSYEQGGSTPGAQSVTVTSSPTGVPFTAAVSSSSPWLSVTPTSGTTTATLNVSANPAGLAVGTHTGTITVTPTGGAAVSLTVTLQVRTSAELTVNPTALPFTYRTGTGAPAGQTVQVGSTGSVLTFNATTTDSWLRITPSTGTTPASVTITPDPSALTPGSYTGTVTFSSTGSTATSQKTVTVTLSITGPLPTIASVGNAASYVGNTVSPGEILFLQGSAMGPEQLTTASPSGGMYPTTVANTRVLFNGVPGALIYTRTDQVSAVVPFSVGARAEIGIQVEYMGQRSNVITLPLVSATPGIFTLNASGSGPGAILNQDYSVNGSGNGAAAGSVIAIYATGGGQTFPASTDSAVATGAARTVLAVQAFIGGREAEVLYAGAAPQLINGALQVNARVPANVAAGTYDLVIRINNVESRPVQVVVR